MSYIIYRHRDEAFNAARGIFQELYFSELENMDVEEYPSESKYPQKYKKMNRMMLSEWMLDVPQDFSESWIMVPCPIGNRTRIVSRYVMTSTYLYLFNINLYFKYEIMILI